MKKAIKFILLVLVILVVAVVLLVKFKLNGFVQQAVEKYGSEYVGVPISLADVDIRLAMGSVSLDGLKVGNPEGYKTPSSFELGNIKVKLDLKSLKTDTIVIQEILIKDPSITYERKLADSNIGELLDHLKKEEAAAEQEPAPEEPAEEKEGAKKVVIDRVLVEGAKVKLSTPLLMGQAVTLPLPKIELADIGKEKEGGTSIPEALTLILSEVLKGIVHAVSNAGDLAVDATKLLGDTALNIGGGALDLTGVAAGAALDVGGKAAGAVGDVGGAAAGVVGDVGGAAAGAVGDVGGAAAGAVTGAAGSITKGIGGLLGGKKDKDEEKDKVE